MHRIFSPHPRRPDPTQYNSNRSNFLAALRRVETNLAKDIVRREYLEDAAKKSGNKSKLPEKTTFWSLDGQTLRTKPKIGPRMLKLQQWFKTTQNTQKDNAVRDHVTLKTLKQSKENPNLILSRTYTYDVESGAQTKIREWRHKIIRLPVDDKKPEKYYKSYCMASCNCPDFLYRVEFAATARGMSQIVYSNGEHPESKNPSLNPSPCKHLYIVFKNIIKNKI